MIRTPPIVTCPQWGARPPRSAPVFAGRPHLIVEHHTDGHGPALVPGVNADYRQACTYARTLQSFHMDVNGWNDSGHSFVVMRSGWIVQGRWGTVRAIEAGRMVISAHCPGQNDQPGIEHEHKVGEPMTEAQHLASVWLQAWIADRCRIRPTELYPHRRFYATDCPDNLADLIPRLRLDVAAKLTAAGKPWPGRRGARWYMGRRLETS